MNHETLLHLVRDEIKFLYNKNKMLLKKFYKKVVIELTLFLAPSRIPSSTDGWMDYVPISEKKKVVDSAQLKEGESPQRSEMDVKKKKKAPSAHHFKAPSPPPFPSPPPTPTHALHTQVAPWCTTVCSWCRTRRR